MGPLFPALGAGFDLTIQEALRCDLETSEAFMIRVRAVAEAGRQLSGLQRSRGRQGAEHRVTYTSVLIAYRIPRKRARLWGDVAKAEPALEGYLRQVRDKPGSEPSLRGLVAFAKGSTKLVASDLDRLRASVEALIERAGRLPARIENGEARALGFRDADADVKGLRDQVLRLGGIVDEIASALSVRDWDADSDGEGSQ